jgi:hypothetical protein
MRLPGGATVASEVTPVQSGSTDGGEMTPRGDDLGADDLRQVVRALGLVDIPEALMPRVLEHLRAHRRSMRKFDESGIDLAGVVTAQPFRA